MFCFLKSLKESCKQCLKSISAELKLSQLSDGQLESIVKFQNNCYSLADISLTFADPNLSTWCLHLSQTAHHLLTQSQSWLLPILSYDIVSVPVHPNQPSILNLHLDRKRAIDLIIKSSFNAKKDEAKQILLLNWNDYQLFNEEWINLRFDYTIECVANICSIFNYNLSIVQLSEINSSIEITTKLAKCFEKCKVNLNLNHLSNFPIEDDNFTFEVSDKLLNQLSSLSQLLNEVESQNSIIFTVHYKSLNEVTQLIWTWSKLYSKENQLHKIIVLPIKAIKSNQNLSEIKKLIELHVSNNVAENYPVDNITRLIETGLRYVVLGLQGSQIFNIDKVKEGLFAQYNYARLESIFQKFVQTYEKPFKLDQSDLTILESDKEWRLIFNYIISFGDRLNEVIETRQFYRLTLFLHNLSKDLSKYYSKTKILTKVTNSSIVNINARMYMMLKLQEIIKTCFYCLGIKPVNAM